MRRMASQPESPVVPAPRYPPKDLVSNFTQDGQCPLASIHYYLDQSNSSKPIHFSAPQFRHLMRVDRHGKVIRPYGDPYRILKPTLDSYRHHIQDGHVAVVGTEMPWAEAMLLNLGARRVTTLEYREIVIEDRRIVAVTPSQFAANFLNAANKGNKVRYLGFKHVALWGRVGVKYLGEAENKR